MNNQQAAGEHLLFIRGTHWNSALSPAELQSVMTAFYTWVDGLRNQGILRGAQPLMEEGKLVTGSRGDVVTDGVFAESKEAIAGYFLLAIDSTAEASGALHVLVNSAGIPDRGVLEQKTPDEVRVLFNAHVVVPLQISQTVLPGMRARGAGTIVNIGSVAGRVVGPAGGAYHVVKSGLEALSLGMRAEVQQFGVRVVQVDPTGVRTPFFDGEFAEVWEYADDDPYAEFMRRRDASVRKLSKLPGAAISADAVARTVVRAIESDNPRPRYVVGASGKASVLLRALVSDRMLQRILLSGMRS